jgi:hypothetical protein
LAAIDVRDRSIFINCPFDAAFVGMFDAFVFAATFCGFTVRSALEVTDSGDLRLAKIVRLIEQSKFSLHDISRVELDKESGLPRFNMPIELGIALGMKHLGRAKLRDHCLLVLDKDKYRYQAFASDLSGVDIAAHDGKPEKAIRVIRDFLAPQSGTPLPGPQAIAEAKEAFDRELPALAMAARQELAELTFVDRLRHLSSFMERLA